MTLIEKLYHPENSGGDSVNRSLVDSFIRDGIIRYHKMSIVSCDKIFNDHFDDASISAALTEAMMIQALEIILRI